VDEAAMYLGVLSRIRLGGIMALEGAAGYRGKQHFRLRSGTGEDFTAAVHSIPLTASLVLYVPLGPTFMPYVVGGLGAHYLILDYSEELNQQSIADKEKVRFGYHVGAGLEIPRAQSKGFGAGVIIGEPTGLNGKGWISQHSAVVGGVGWRLGVGKDRLQLHADYLWHFHEWIRSSQQFSPYVGVGGRLMSIDGDGVFGVRIPFGIVWIPEDAPLDVFLEVVPVVDLAPATDLNGNGGVGIRFFFQ
jgi:outer membrane protein W